jgi:endonuclease/exonuclease/phosphatase (EEP) superfamily protein YafD
MITPIWFKAFTTLLVGLWLLGQCHLGWLSDLASHFQVQYFLSFCALALVALQRRLWAWLAFLLLVSIITYNSVAPYAVSTADSKTASAPAVRVMQANVLLKNHDYDRVIKAIQKYNPDILSLQEVDPGWLESLHPALKAYPYHIERVHVGRYFGIALFSKLPLSNVQIRYLDGVSRPVLLADVLLGGQKIMLAAMHPYSPGSLVRYYNRDRQLQAFVKTRQALRENLILLGDLNNSPFSVSFRDFLKQSGLKDARIGQGVYPTWPALLPLLWIPIDHVLVSPAFEVTGLQTGPYIGSDHLPLIVDLSFKGSGSHQ